MRKAQYDLVMDLLDKEEARLTRLVLEYENALKKDEAWGHKHLAEENRRQIKCWQSRKELVKKTKRDLMAQRETQLKWQQRRRERNNVKKARGTA